MGLSVTLRMRIAAQAFGKYIMMTQKTDNHLRADLHADDDLVPFDVRDYSSKRAMRLLWVVIGILFIAALLVFKAYYGGVRDRATPPVINADKTPYKVAPDNPGGEVTPNQDKTIYDVMNGSANNETVTPAAPSEQPIEMPKSATIVVRDAPSKIQTPARPKPVVKAPEPVRPKQFDSVHLVQVASVRSQAAAEDLWRDVSRRHAVVMPTTSYPDIQRVDLGNKGIFYRLRIAGLPDKAEASRLCDSLKARNQACFVASR